MVSLSVGRGEKLSTKAGAGLTAKGRAKYNKATGSKLKAPAPNPKSEYEKVELWQVSLGYTPTFTPNAHA
jgi:hypothetical protein